MKTIAVTGSRTFDDYELVRKTLDALAPQNCRLLTGAGTGADDLVWLYAKRRGLPVKALGPRPEDEPTPDQWRDRNNEMLSEADHLIVFGFGETTGHLVNQATIRRVKTTTVNPPEPETPAEPQLPEVGTVCRYKSYKHSSTVACHIRAVDGSFRAILQHPQGGWDMAKAEDLRPHTITINGVEVPAPETQAPKLGTKYWVLHYNAKNEVAEQTWVNDRMDNLWLNRGLVHLSRKNAERVTEVLFPILRGEK